MIKLPTIIRIALLCLLAYAFPVAHAYATPNLQFNQTTVTVLQNTTFQLKVNINVDANAVFGSDAVVNYAASDLQVINVTNGGFFPQFAKATDTAGKIELHGFVGQNDSRTGNGTLAIITFKGLKSSGSSTISYNCSASGTDTNILTTTGANILTCGQLNTSAITYTTSGATSTHTPTPTTAPGTTATPTPTPNPGGNTTPVCASLYSDISSAVGTPLAVTFTCSGVDTDGYINAAEFVFGDGSTQVVQKNAGSPGSIATTHTFTTIGTLGVSCRVRDNNTVYSQVPENCKKIVTIKQSPKVITAAATIIRATPTPQLVTIISETPEPTPQITIEVTPTPEELTTTVQSGNNRFWWIVGGALAVILAFVLLRRRTPPPPPPTIPPMNPPTDVSNPMQPQM